MSGNEARWRYQVVVTTTDGDSRKEGCLSLAEVRRVVARLRSAWASGRPEFEVIEIDTGEVVDPEHWSRAVRGVW